MAPKTAVEEEFGLDLDVDNPDVGKCVAAGIRFEKDQTRFYSGMEEVMRNHVLIRFFEFLSSEKRLQGEMLKKARKNLEHKKEWPRIEYDHGDINSAFREAGELMGKLRKDLGDIDMVTNASKKEADATDFYERLSDAIRGAGNDFFRTLAEREQRHHDLLVAILDLLKQAK